MKLYIKTYGDDYDDFFTVYKETAKAYLIKIGDDSDNRSECKFWLSKQYIRSMNLVTTGEGADFSHHYYIVLDDYYYYDRFQEFVNRGWDYMTPEQVEEFTANIEEEETPEAVEEVKEEVAEATTEEEEMPKPKFAKIDPIKAEENRKAFIDYFKALREEKESVVTEVVKTKKPLYKEMPLIVRVFREFFEIIFGFIWAMSPLWLFYLLLEGILYLFN